METLVFGLMRILRLCPWRDRLRCRRSQWPA